MDLALTFDDLPGRGAWRPPADRLTAVDLLVATLARHSVAGAYGFVNGGELARAADASAVIDRWTAHGHRLGNHTYSHLDLHARADVSAFVEDIERNAAALDRTRMFRFPYLNAGETDSQCQAVDAYLRDHGYVTAEVTVDFADWRWNREGGHDAAGFVVAGVAAMRQARTLAGVLFRRPIAHVALLHFGPATAQYLDALLQAFVAEGARFVPLEQALADPVYATAVTARPRVGTFLNKIGRAAGVCGARS